MFEEIKKLLGFGVMRLPLDKDNKVNFEDFQKMVDYFMCNGFNYFDTAHVYLNGQSEIAIRECLSKRYKREDFVLANKLSSSCFSKEEDIIPFFNKQLECCGVDYFDIYLMHAQQRNNYEQYQNANAYEIAKHLKSEGKIKHIGISFHDTADFLDKILTEHPEIEVVQLQFNYLDMEDPKIQSRLCYETAIKHGKQIIVMEPVKGGSLVKLPKKADEILRNLNNGSNASFAIRFAASFNRVIMVLSGMSNMEQLVENVSFMKDFKEIDNIERAALEHVANAINKVPTIACTSCRYCVDGCPKNIPIPDIFYDYNLSVVGKGDMGGCSYVIDTYHKGEARDCIKCGKCEKVCPQHLKIRDLLEKVSKLYDD